MNDNIGFNLLKISYLLNIIVSYIRFETDNTYYILNFNWNIKILNLK